MEHLDVLAAKLHDVDHDRSRLSTADAAEVFSLAARAGVELWRDGLSWPSSAGAEERGGALTSIGTRL